MITPVQFARVLAERLAPILPGGYCVRADEGVVHVDAPDGLGAATSVMELLDRDDLGPQDYADAAWAVLSLAQDVVSETTSDPWPAPLGPGSEVAEPGTAAEDGRISLWFGAEDQPVVTLRPIEIEGRS